MSVSTSAMRSKRKAGGEWDGGQIIDAMIVRGDLSIGDLTPDEIANFGPEAQRVLKGEPNRVERFVKKAMDRTDDRNARELEARRLASRGSEATQSARLANAQAKRERRKAKRLPKPAKPTTPEQDLRTGCPYCGQWLPIHEDRFCNNARRHSSSTPE